MKQGNMARSSLMIAPFFFVITETITSTVTIYQFDLPNGQLGAVSMSMTAGDIAISIGLMVVSAALLFQIFIVWRGRSTARGASRD